MDDNRSRVILESLRQSESMMKSQMTIALASDARALTFCGLTLAAASLLVGLADTSGFALAMYVAGALMYVAAGVSGWSAMPIDWFAPGQKGGDFRDDITENKPFDAVALEMVAYNDKQIGENEAKRKRLNRRLVLSAFLAVTAAPLGVVAEVIAGML